jgi:hypothetical protein
MTRCHQEGCDNSTLEVRDLSENMNLRLLRNYKVTHKCHSDPQNEEVAEYVLFGFLQHSKEECPSLTYCKLCDQKFPSKEALSNHFKSECLNTMVHFEGSFSTRKELQSKHAFSFMSDVMELAKLVEDQEKQILRIKHEKD